MKTLIVKKIPDDVHLAFKVMAVEKQTTIRDELIRLMREAVEKHRRERR